MPMVAFGMSSSSAGGWAGREQQLLGGLWGFEGPMLSSVGGVAAGVAAIGCCKQGAGVEMGMMGMQQGSAVGSSAAHVPFDLKPLR